MSNMKSADGRYCQRVGALIEKYICEKYDLLYNRRQKIKGYYDAYDKNTLYEIKATNSRSNNFQLNEKNHRTLTGLKGQYIFVLYSLKNKDKDLTVASDITIERAIFRDAVDVDTILRESNAKKVTVKRSQKTLLKIRANKVLSPVKKSDGVETLTTDDTDKNINGGGIKGDTKQD